jgi:hypothetical protein
MLVLCYHILWLRVYVSRCLQILVTESYTELLKTIKYMSGIQRNDLNLLPK